jgi:hypothetical protein
MPVGRNRPRDLNKTVLGLGRLVRRGRPCARVNEPSVPTAIEGQVQELPNVAEATERDRPGSGPTVRVQVARAEAFVAMALKLAPTPPGPRALGRVRRARDSAIARNLMAFAMKRIVVRLVVGDPMQALADQTPTVIENLAAPVAALVLRITQTGPIDLLATGTAVATTGRAPTPRVTVPRRRRRGRKFGANDNHVARSVGMAGAEKSEGNLRNETMAVGLNHGTGRREARLAPTMVVSVVDLGRTETIEKTGRCEQNEVTDRPTIATNATIEVLPRCGPKNRVPASGCQIRHRPGPKRHARFARGSRLDGRGKYRTLMMIELPWPESTRTCQSRNATGRQSFPIPFRPRSTRLSGLVVGLRSASRC